MTEYELHVNNFGVHTVCKSNYPATVIIDAVVSEQNRVGLTIGRTPNTRFDYSLINISNIIYPLDIIYLHNMGIYIPSQYTIPDLNHILLSRTHPSTKSNFFNNMDIMRTIARRTIPDLYIHTTAEHGGGNNVDFVSNISWDTHTTHPIYYDVLNPSYKFITCDDITAHLHYVNNDTCLSTLGIRSNTNIKNYLLNNHTFIIDTGYRLYLENDYHKKNIVNILENDPNHINNLISCYPYKLDMSVSCFAKITQHIIEHNNIIVNGITLNDTSLHLVEYYSMIDSDNIKQLSNHDIIFVKISHIHGYMLFKTIEDSVMFNVKFSHFLLED